MDWIWTSCTFNGFAIGIAVGLLVPKAYKVGIQLSTLVNPKNATKMVLVVRSDLGMGKGKIASQCSHAAVECYRSGLNSRRKIVELWQMCGQPKVVLKVSSEQELTMLYNKCKSVGLNCNLIKDDGRTQLNSGTATVLGIGPDKTNEIDLITSDLKLL